MKAHTTTSSPESRTSSANPERLVGYTEVLARVPVARSTLWRMIRAGQFPPPLKIGARRVGWKESTLISWMDR